MRCSAVVARLDALRTGELPEPEQSAVAEHLETCEPCVEELEAVERLARDLRGLRVRAPEDLLERVVAEAADRYGSVDTAIGRVWVGYDARGVTLVHAGVRDAGGFERMYERRLGRRPVPAELPPRYARAVERAAAGGGSGAPPVDLSALPAFEREVLMGLTRIPRGEVRPYAWLAREVGRPRAVRAVGNALAKNPVPLILPCHRVVPTSGGVGRYALGGDLKRQLLEREGVPVDELEGLARRGVRFVGSRRTGAYCYPTCKDVRETAAGERVPLGSEHEAVRAGFEPCRRCRPAAAA